MEPDTPQRAHKGYTSKIFTSIVVLFFLLYCIISPGNTHNILALLGAIAGACVALLQVPYVQDWIHKIGAVVDLHAGNMGRNIIQRAIRGWARRDILLAFILLGSLFGTFTPVRSVILDSTQNTLCIQNPFPLPFCGNGIYVTPMQVDEGQGDQLVISTINIGIIDNSNAGPFNQYDASNNDTESDLEKKIFQENQDCRHPSPVTLIIATSLSQTVTDTGLSSNVGLNDLRGAYIVQRNFNRSQQQFCLQLLIANFGTKGVAAKTVPPLMRQIKLYAESHKQSFLGVVGFPFSISLTAALNERSRIHAEDVTIISPTAVADSFYTQPGSPPNRFYDNVYRVVSPVSVESKVMKNFMALHSQGDLAPDKNRTVLFEDYNEPYSQSLGQAIFSANSNFQPEPYTEGQPASLDKGMQYIIDQQCKPGQQACLPIQIFFAGFSDDLNALKNKLNAARNQGKLTQPIQIIGGEGLYDLGSYNVGNYANLVFTINASSARINPAFSSSSPAPIPAEFQRCQKQPAPFNKPFNCEFISLFGQNYPTNIFGSELVGMHVLLTYDAVQTLLQALVLKTFLSKVQFQGVSGPISFAVSPNSAINPSNKPMYVACTDSSSYTHIVAEYDTGTYQPSYINDSELNKCLRG